MLSMRRRYSLMSLSTTIALSMSAISVDLVRVEPLHQAEVEERHLAARAEQVVAGVRVAVEGVQAVEAAEHEAEDGLGGEVALLLAPPLDLVEAGALGQLGGEHPLGAELVDHRRDVDERVARRSTSAKRRWLSASLT